MPLGPENLEQELFRILDILEAARIPHCLTGAQARNAYAEPRTSMDFDVVLQLSDHSADDVRALFEAEGYAVDGPLQGDLGRRFVLDLPDYEADLWLAPNTELHRQEFENARRIRYGSRELPVMAPQDFVLRKLANFGRIRGRQHDLDDAYHVLLNTWDEIDVDALLAQAAFYRVAGLATRIVDEVRADLNKAAEK